MSENEWIPSSHDAFPLDYRRRAESADHESKLREVRKQASTEALQLAALSLGLIKTLERLDPAIARVAAADELSRFRLYVDANEFPNLRDVLGALAQVAKTGT